MLLEKLADFIMRRAKIIVVLWIVVLLVSVPFILKSNSVLQYDMSKMSSNSEMESLKGTEMLKSGEFNSDSSMSAGTIIIIEAYDSLAGTVASQVKENLQNEFFFWDVNEDLREKGGLDCEVKVKHLGRFDDKYFADKNTQMIIYVVSYPELPEGVEMKFSSNIPAVRGMVSDATEGVDGIVGTYVTGTDAISYDTSSGANKDIHRIDPISVLLVLILIGLFFRSLITAATPPVVIGMAYGVLLALVFGIGSILGIYYITTILVLVSMLGAGCDYCIFIVSRYREERIGGKDHDAALRESIIWAGESIITSGVSVIIGFGSLMLCSFSLVSTMGLVLALGIVLALLAALTFVPSLLMIVGDKIFWPAKISSDPPKSGFFKKMGEIGHRYFTHSATSAIKYAKVFVVVTILLTVPLAYIALSSQSSYDMISAMPPGEAKDGVAIISDNLGGGLLMPTMITMKVDAFVDVNINSEVKSGDRIPSGTDLTFEATPYTGYKVSGWYRDGVFHDMETNIYEALDVAADTEITVVFVKQTYNVHFMTNDATLGTVTAKANGQSIESGAVVDFGTELDFNAAPADGCRVDYWTISRNGTPTDEYIHDTELTIGQASYDYVITAHFGATPTVTHIVTYENPMNGSIMARADEDLIDSGANVLERSHMVFSAIPDQGYKVKKWTVNGADAGTSSTLTIDSLSEDSIVAVEFEAKNTNTYNVIFSSNDPTLGTVTATADGVEIASGTAVREGSTVVFTAAPKGDNVVYGWTYTMEIPVYGPHSVTSYVNKTQHTITSINSDEEVQVIFDAPGSETVMVNYADPAGGHGTLTSSQGSTSLPTGAVVQKGSDVFFTATVEDGYHIRNWSVQHGTDPATTVETRANTISLYDLSKDVTVTYVTEADSFVTLTFGTNDDTLGSVKAICDEIYEPYVERANAPEIYSKLNEFAASLMDMTTDGKKNVALAIGPTNGDFLFDGQHEWVMDTVSGVLPEDWQAYAGNGIAYDALVYVWKNVLTYELKQEINYYLTYKLGFISKPFTEDDGHEYQYVKFMVATKDEPMSALSVETIKQMYDCKDDFIDANDAEDGGFAYEGYLSGAAVSNYETSVLVNKDFKFIIVIVVVLLVLLLFIVMRSYLTPIRAVGTILMSVLWTLGLTYIIFDMWLNTPVVWVVPIVLFVVCLGLGMDYDILLTTRIRENVSKGMTNDEAIIAAVQKSGVIITLCGLIMAGAFGTMMVSTSPMLREFGFALGFAIAVDALVIRTYVVPAIMHLLGDWNWKGPDYGAIKAKLFKKRTEE